MKTKDYLCVDCVENLEEVPVGNLTLFYCNNAKCRRFGVLTLGGLEHWKCEKVIMLEGKEAKNCPK
jgi:hypothetical protein